LAGLRVLLVDDNEVSRSVISRALHNVGMYVSEENSGHIALTKLIALPDPQSGFDVLLLDAHLPDTDGLTTARQIRSLPQYAKLPMVIMVSAGHKGNVSFFNEDGLSAVLSKPFTPFELVQVLDGVIDPPTTLPRGMTSHQEQQEGLLVLDVLLVEDNIVNQKLAIALLERWGHVVTVADNGQSALERLAQHRFDLVLMDMMMPVLDGLEATRQFRRTELGSRTPIVAMTANVMPGDRERCIQAGMDDYISKPITTAELQRVLSRFARVVPEAQTLSAASCHVEVLSESDGRADVLFDYATALRDVDQDVVEIIADVFVAQWPKDVLKMTQALENDDRESLLQVAHALKGTLGMFGAIPAVALASELEGLASLGEDLGKVKLAESPQIKLVALCKQVDYLLEALRSWRPQ
jgi:CheY-like chemotaxis protein/HPt (histidine-containing phosphotransfer) domain-containing protein